MAEKILNTRVQLRYDTLTKWNSINPVLKKGEIAVAYLAESHTTPANYTGNQHPVLFKVGDGTTEFDKLPFASALAADVYSWAKQSENDFVTNFLSMKDSAGSTIQAKLDAIFATGDELSSAISSLRTELTGDNGLAGAIARIKAIEDDYLKAADKTTLEGKITAEENRAKGEEARLAGLIAAIDYVDDTELAAAVKEETDRAMLAEKALDEAIKAIDFIDEDELTSALANYETVAEADKVRARVKAIEDAPYATESHVSSAISTARSEITTEIGTAISNSATTEGGVISNVIAKADAAQEAADEAMEKAEEGVTKAEAAQLAADAAQKAIDDFLIGENVTEAVDTLKEIQEELKSLSEAVNLTESFAKKADKVTGATSGNFAGLDANGNLTDSGKKAADFATAEQGTKADNALPTATFNSTIANYYTKTEADAEFMNGGEVDAKIAAALNGDNAIKVDSAKNADVAAKASGLDDAGVAAVKAVKVDNATNADTATNATQLGGVAAADYLLASTAAGTYETIANVAVISGNVSKNTGDISAINTLLGGYGDIVTHNVAEFATAAQGSLADSALQEITTTENGGLKVTNKNKIDIDDSITFIFNCGDAEGKPLN